MSDMMENKLNAEELDTVSGGAYQAYDRPELEVIPITPYRVRVTSSSLNCRYTPNGPIIKTYEHGHKLKVDGITGDGQWYRLLVNDPRGGTIYGFIFKAYTERI